MVQLRSQEYQPEIPSGVKVIAWIIQMFAGLSLVILEILTIRAPRGEVMFSYLGHDYVVAGIQPGTMGMELVFLTHGLVIVSAVFTLKGRMWAYYILFTACALNVLTTILATVLHLVARRFDLMAWLPFVVLWMLIRDYRGYRDFARSRTAQHQPG